LLGHPSGPIFLKTGTYFEPADFVCQNSRNPAINERQNKNTNPMKTESKTNRNTKPFNHPTRSGPVARPLGLSTCLGLALGALFCALSQSAQAQLPDVSADYTIQTIENPPGTDINEIYLVLINDAGMVAMQYNTLSGGGTVNEGQTAVLEKGVWTVINVPGSAWTGCGNPNASGDVPLAYANPDGNWHNALWHHGTYTYLPDCEPPYQCGLQLINDDRIMTGLAFDPTSTSWDPVADFYSGHGVLLNASLSLFQLFDYPGAYSTYALGINNAGQIVGSYTSPSDNGWHCFLSDGGRTFVNIDPPGSANPPDSVSRSVTMINNQGDIAGFYTDAITGVLQGFLLRNGKFSAFNVPQSSLTILTGITDNGNLSGLYYDSGGTPHAFLATRQGGRH
jgi:hypothetical protein